MRDYSYSESVLNAENMLDYTAYYSRHVDGKAAAALTASQDNLAKSEKVLEDSIAQLHEAKIALSNLQLQNLMTRFTHYTASQRKKQAFQKFWSDRQDVGLRFPGFLYQGRDAILAYLDGVAAQQDAKLHELQGDAYCADTAAQMRGAGFSDCMMLCTPYIVIAEDGHTAKGIWNLMHIMRESRAGKRELSDCVYEIWYVDFINENEAGDWKIWHMDVNELFAEAFNESILPPGPMELRKPRVGGDSPPGNLAMGGMQGMPGMPGGSGGGLQVPSEPKYPEPYETYTEEMLLSQHKARALDYVGIVPEYMMHLPFVFQPDGPPGMGGSGPKNADDSGSLDSPNPEKA